MIFLEPIFCRKPVYKISGLGLKEQVKVALTGDWHVSEIVSDKQYNFLKTRLTEIQPDVIILQGDFFDTPDSFKDSDLVSKLRKSLMLCAEIAPTVMVIGNHDQVRPVHKEPVSHADYLGRILPNVIDDWRRICRETGVKLLVDSWFEVKGLRIFGFFQDPEIYYVKPGAKGENIPAMRKKIKRLANEGVLSTKPKKANWFVAHAPINELYKMKELEEFKIFSFGHTHGACLPIGADVLADKLDFHGGIVAPFMKWFPTRYMCGRKKYDNNVHYIVNTGMVMTQQSAPLPLRYINFLKSAEITEVIVS